MHAPLPQSWVRRWLGAPAIRLYETAAFYVVLAAYGIVFLGWNLVAALAYRVLPRAWRRRAGQLGIMYGFRFLLWLMQALRLARFDLSALDALRDEAGLVIVPNHPTLLDVLLVTSRLPRIVCITKASLWDNPALGAGARLAGYLRNDAPFRLIGSAAEALGAGNQLLIFPEGTRTTTPPVGAFKGGFALMAKQADVPVQAVILHASSPYISKGWPVWRRPAFPLVYSARLGRRFTVDGPATGFSSDLEAYFRSELGPP